MKKKYFGTDGIRGTVGDAVVNPEFMLKLGWAAGKVLAQDDLAVVLIGKDTRISGYMLESALEAGFSAAGVNTLLLGPMPTPAIAYLTQSVRASAGVAISASHNPYEDNGIKFFDSRGYKLSDDLEYAIEALIDTPMSIVRSACLGKAARMVDAAGRYIEFCKSTFPSQLDLKNLHILVDCAHGAAYSIAPQIFHELGAQVTPIAHAPDGLNINKECGAAHIEYLQRAVQQQPGKMGIALDGDGDRVIMVDEQGEIVDGDELLGIIALGDTDCHPKPLGIVGTVMSNGGLEQALSAAGIAFTRTAVGDRYVLEKLKEKNWVLGGESSGHIVDLRYTTTGDGIVTALHILRIMIQTGKTLSSLKRVMVKRPQVLINVRLLHPVSGNALHSDLQDYAQALEKSLEGEGRILLRPSGTEPLIRVMVEGNDAETVQRTAEILAHYVSSHVSSSIVSD